MLDAVLDALHRKKKQVLEKIGKLSSEALEITVEHEPLPKPVYTNLFAVDGSMNLKEYKNFIVYAVDAETLGLIDRKIRVINRLADIDILIPYWLPRERVRLYMSILETRAALEALNEKEAEYVFMDGSLTSEIIRPIGYRPKNFGVERLIKHYRPMLENAAVRSEPEIASKQIIERKAEMNEHPGLLNELSLFLEYVEHLASVRELLFKYKNRVVGVAKRSQSNFLFNLPYPDIAILEEKMKEAGYVVAAEPQTLESSKRYLPAYKELLNFPFTVVYVRLEKEGPVLKVEVAGEADEDTIKEVVAVMRSVSVQGYPYLLAQVHRDVEITNSDMETLVRLLGLYWAKTGREALGRGRKRTRIY